MTTIYWPETLPLTLRMNGLSAKRNSNVIRTTMDAGPAKARRRYTASTKSITGSMLLDESQKDEFDQFYSVTLADGVLRFNFTDPQTLKVAEFRFTDDPTENSVDGKFEISMQLEKLS